MVGWVCLPLAGVGAHWLVKGLIQYCFMKFSFIFQFTLSMAVGLASCAHSEIQFNPSLSETQKVAILKELEADKERLRKEPLHGVISIDRQNHPSASAVCWVGILGQTNITTYKPLPTQAFEAQLLDEDGKEVKKTSYGRQFGEPASPDQKLLDGTFRKDAGEAWGRSRELRFATGDGSSHYWDFDVLKAFKIKEPGEYRLQVTVRLFSKDTNGVFKPLILPPVSQQLKITDDDLK